MERFIRAAGALGITVPRYTGRRLRYMMVWLFVIATCAVPAGASLAASSLTNASVALSDPRPSPATASYTFTGSSVDTGSVVKCVKVVWSTTASGDTAPAGFSGTAGSVTAASSTLINSSATGWSLAKSDGTSSSGQNNIYKYTNSSGVTPSTATGATFILAGLTNASTTDTAYYFTLSTYGNTDCVSSGVNTATTEYIHTNGSTLSLTVDASLSFSVNAVSTGQTCDGVTTTGSSTATTISFGSVTPASNRVVCQDLQAATNASHGYSIYIRYSGAPSDGTDTIADAPGSNASPQAFPAAGTEAYGYATDDATLGTGTADRFTNPSQGWAALSTSNAEVGYEAAPAVTTSYHVAHQVGISTLTHAGIYQTTVIYTCTPVY